LTIDDWLTVIGKPRQPFLETTGPHNRFKYSIVNSQSSINVVILALLDDTLSGSVE
jgi:hypothetical protein